MKSNLCTFSSAKSDQLLYTNSNLSIIFTSVPKFLVKFLKVKDRAFNDTSMATP